jgi:RNA polymerase sigma-70 factor (ECF subfamily)
MQFFKRKYRSAEDEQLMEWLARGDECAFSHLYDRYASGLHAFFFKMLYADTHLAEDFVQELFCRVFENTDRFDSRRSFRTWLFSMAYNLCKNEYRKRERMPNPEAIPLYPGTEEEYDNSWEEARKKQLLEYGLKQLKESQRECLCLRYQQGFSIQEISEILRIPKGTVKSRLYYAIKELAEIVGARVKDEGRRL